MSCMYGDEQVLLDLDSVVAARLTCRAGPWLLDVLLALGPDGETFSLAYPTRADCAQALRNMRARLGDAAALEVLAIEKEEERRDV